MWYRKGPETSLEEHGAKIWKEHIELWTPDQPSNWSEKTVWGVSTVGVRWSGPRKNKKMWHSRYYIIKFRRLCNYLVTMLLSFAVSASKNAFNFFNRSLTTVLYFPLQDSTKMTVMPIVQSFSILWGFQKCKLWVSQMMVSLQVTSTNGTMMVQWWLNWVLYFDTRRNKNHCLLFLLNVLGFFFLLCFCFLPCRSHFTKRFSQYVNLFMVWRWW